ncbi:hypothetical protein Tco_0514949 [Tanacetum coccineum]
MHIDVLSVSAKKEDVSGITYMMKSNARVSRYINTKLLVSDVDVRCALLAKIRNSAEMRLSVGRSGQVKSCNMNAIIMILSNCRCQGPDAWCQYATTVAGWEEKLRCMTYEIEITPANGVRPKGDEYSMLTKLCLSVIMLLEIIVMLICCIHSSMTADAIISSSYRVLPIIKVNGNDIGDDYDSEGDIGLMRIKYIRHKESGF